jgi:dienelactone hydrolase
LLNRGKHMIRIKFIVIVVFLLIGCASGPVDDEKFLIRTHIQNYPANTIVVIHGSGGVTAHEEAWALQLKNEGYNTVIIDSYTKRGISSHPGKIIDNFGADDRAREIVKLAKWVKTQQWHKGKIGLIGFSQGGSAILALSSKLRMEIMNKVSEDDIKIVDFAVLYYPGCTIAPPDKEPLFPMQIHFAQQDDLAQPWRCYPNTLTHKNFELFFYENARHTFDWARSDVFINGRHFSYHHQSNMESRERVKTFISNNTK